MTDTRLRDFEALVSELPVEEQEEARRLWAASQRSSVVTLSDLKIRTKAARLVEFEPNNVQCAYLDLLAPGWKPDRPIRLEGVRENILKARQEGFSTIILALLFCDACNKPYTRSLVVADDEKRAAYLLEIVQRYYDHLPDAKRPPTKFRNRNELYFADRDSAIVVGTAGDPTLGRGLTLNAIHMSERAWWGLKCRNVTEVERGMLEAVPREGNVFKETTANGRNDYYEQYQADRDGDSRFTSRFFGWNAFAGNRLAPGVRFERTHEEQRLAETYQLDDAQLAWRRDKRRDLADLFEQEHPISVEEAFLRSTTNAYFHQAYLLSLLPDLPKPIRIDRPGDTGYTLDGVLYTVEPPITHDTWQCRQWNEAMGQECGTVFRLHEAGRVNSVQGVCCPQCGRPAMRMRVEYVIGCDCCGGVGGMDESNPHDWHAIDVFRRDTWRQVASYHGRCDLQRLGRDLARLGHYYNMADVLVEQDPRGYGLKVMEEMLLGEPGPMKDPIPYPHVRHWNAPVLPNGTYKPVDRQQWGYVVTTKSKLLRDSKLQSAILTAAAGGDSIALTCPRPINQLLSYVDVEGERAADGNGKDDHVCSVGLAHLLLLGHRLARVAEEEDRNEMGGSLRSERPEQAAYGRNVVPGPRVGWGR